MHRRAFFDADCVHDGDGAVSFDGHHRRAVSNARHHRKHKSEAVEKRNGDAKFVVFCKFHTVADGFAVVQDIVVREHYALRKACRARGILHIHDVVGVQRFFVFLVNFDGKIAAQNFKVFKIEHTFGRFFPCKNDAFQKRQMLRLYFAGSRFQFGQKLVHGCDVVVVFESADHHEKFRVRLPQKVFQLKNFEIGIDGYKHRADFRRREQRQNPFGRVGCPDCDVIALFDAQRHHAACDEIRLVVKFFPGAEVISVGISYRPAVRIVF